MKIINKKMLIIPPFCKVFLPSYENKVKIKIKKWKKNC